MSKIAYITAKIPYGSQETFILTEILSLKQSGIDLLIIPRDKGKKVFNKEAVLLIKDTINIPWFNLKIFLNLLIFILLRLPEFFDIIYTTILKARNIKIGLKNLIILPKSLYLSNILKEKVSHIHAHWASTTSTMAYIISKVTGIPWSFTAHRWDISENNLLKEKCKNASFVRTICHEGRDEILEIIRDNYVNHKILVIHMGIKMPETGNKNQCASRPFTILCPANLVIKKGHKYLFEACKILLEKNVKFKCLIAGDGPLENELRNLTVRLKLEGCIEFLGRLPHDRLLDLYSTGEIDTVVLPSIITPDGEKEGIPVALMEAMSYKVPVISTNTGGISELIENSCGVMVDEKNPRAIAIALEKLIKNTNYREYISRNGEGKVQRDFNVSIIAQKLLKLFSVYSAK